MTSSRPLRMCWLPAPFRVAAAIGGAALLYALLVATAAAQPLWVTSLDNDTWEYLVQPGDTLRWIAERHGTTVGELAALNGLDNPNLIRAGQRLRVPVTGPRYAASARGAGGFVWPAAGPISSYFGESGQYWIGGYHQGLDIIAPIGAPVRAAASGVVIEAASGWAGYGTYVKVDHGGGLHTLYAHLAAAYVVPGQRVAAGEAIGAVGVTGFTTGPHLHFEVRQHGVKRDPLSYLR